MKLIKKNNLYSHVKKTLQIEYKTKKKYLYTYILKYKYIFMFF